QDSPRIRHRDLLVLPSPLPPRLVEHGVPYLPFNRRTSLLSAAIWRHYKLMPRFLHQSEIRGAESATGLGFDLLRPKYWLAARFNPSARGDESTTEITASSNITRVPVRHQAGAVEQRETSAQPVPFARARGHAVGNAPLTPLLHLNPVAATKETGRSQKTLFRHPA